MPARLHADDLTDAERLVQSRMGDQPFDFAAMSCVANMYRAATAFRNRVERRLLSGHDVSWSGFTALFVLWVWGPSDATQLAEDVGVSNATLTGLISTLQGRGLVDKVTPARDRRRTVVSLTVAGRAVIEEVFPQFHAFEVNATAGIPHGEQRVIAEGLRRIIRWSEDEPG